MKWPMIPFSKVAEVVTGNTPPKKDSENYGPGIPWVKPPDLDAWHPITKTEETLSQVGQRKARLLPPGTVMVCCIGSIGRVGIAGTILATNQQINSLVFGPLFEPRFGYYYCRSIVHIFHAAARQAVVPILNKGNFEKIEMPLPPLSEQQRIVEILDQADALRKKRAEADAKADRILDALFIRLFGDPATNPKGWRVSTLGNVTRVIHRYPTFYGQKYVESGVPVVRISDILPNHILSREIDQYAKVPESFSDKFPLTILESNDVVMAVRGDTTGKIGLVPNELHGSNISPNLIRISPNTNELNHYYLFSYMLLAVHNFKPYITDTAKKSITARNLKSIRIFIPPMALQERFRSMVSKILQMNEHWLTRHSRIEKLFTILLHRAFCGELTAAWREGHMKELLAEMREQAKYLAPHGAHNQRENAVQQESLF